MWAGRGRLVLTDGAEGEEDLVQHQAGRRGWVAANMLGHTGGSWVGRGKDQQVVKERRNKDEAGKHRCF